MSSQKILTDFRHDSCGFIPFVNMSNFHSQFRKVARMFKLSSRQLGDILGMSDVSVKNLLYNEHRATSVDKILNLCQWVQAKGTYIDLGFFWDSECEPQDYANDLRNKLKIESHLQYEAANYTVMMAMADAIQRLVSGSIPKDVVISTLSLYLDGLSETESDHMRKLLGIARESLRGAYVAETTQSYRS